MPVNVRVLVKVVGHLSMYFPFLTLNTASHTHTHTHTHACTHAHTHTHIHIVIYSNFLSHKKIL